MQITNPDPEELSGALQAAFSSLSPGRWDVPVDTLLDRYARGELALDGIFQAKQDARRLGALFSQYRADGIVLFRPPSAELAHGVADALLDALEKFCRRRRARAAVSMFGRNRGFDEDVLRRGLFEPLSDLVMLVTDITDADASPPRGPTEFEPMDTRGPLSDRLLSLVRATYRASRDFPRLMDLAPVDGVLEGYRSDADGEPGPWFFVRESGRDAGVLLLADRPDDRIELTYMGLVEDARGRGLARGIVRFARHEAYRRRRAFLLTSVDERNTPAVKAYLGEGFRAWDRLRVFARFFEKGE